MSGLDSAAAGFRRPLAVRYGSTSATSPMFHGPIPVVLLLILVQVLHKLGRPVWCAFHAK